MTRALLTAFVALSLWQGEALTRDLMPPIQPPAIRPQTLLPCGENSIQLYKQTCRARHRMERIGKL